MHTPPADAAPGLAPSAPETSPSRHRRRYLIWLVVVLAFAGLFWWVVRGNEGAKRRPGAGAGAVSVVSATVQQADLPVYLDAIGTVTPVHTTTVASQVNGQVMAVHYEEGQLVRPGTPLVEIDPRPFAATLLQAQGALERDTQILAQSEMDLERYRAAWAKNAIAKQQLDDQEHIVLQNKGTVKNDLGTVQFDAVQLSFCRITSPISGRVGLRLVDPGNIVTAAGGTALAVVTQLQPITVVFTVSEDDMSQVFDQSNHGAQLPVDALDRTKSKKLATGRLMTIDNQIDTTTGTVKLRAVFDNHDETLFPNQFVNTRLLVRTVPTAAILPSSTVQHDANQAFVYVIESGHAHVRHIKTGIVEGDVTQVDVAPGTVVANSSFERLQDGAAVRIGTAVAAASPTTSAEGASP